MSSARKTKKQVKKTAKSHSASSKPAGARAAAKGAAKSGAARPAPQRPQAGPNKPEPQLRVAAGAAAKGEPPKGGGAPTKKSQRKSGSRREGKSYAPGDLLLPGGCLTNEELQYFFRGCVAAEHSVPEDGLQDVLTKRGLPEGDAAGEDIKKVLVGVVERFASGVIEPVLPSRALARRTIAGFVERVRGRRREIGAFLRGLDLGRTEVSHLDSHSETSLQNLMEWTARIEKMVEEGEEPEHADYNQLHRGIDQVDNTTEALIVDLETTLRRLRDRAQ